MNHRISDLTNESEKLKTKIQQAERDKYPGKCRQELIDSLNNEGEAGIDYCQYGISFKVSSSEIL